MYDFNNDQMLHHQDVPEPQIVYPPIPTTNYPYDSVYEGTDETTTTTDDRFLPLWDTEDDELPETAASTTATRTASLLVSRLRQWMSKYLAVAVAIVAVLLYQFHVPLYQFWMCHQDTSLLFTIYDLYWTISDHVRAYVQMVMEYVRNSWQHGILLWRFTRTAVAPMAMPELEVEDQQQQQQRWNYYPEYCTSDAHASSSSSLWLQDDLEPAFLREEDYPADWMVYHPVLGVVQKTVADNYQKHTTSSSSGLLSSSRPELSRNGTPEMIPEEEEEEEEVNQKKKEEDDVEIVTAESSCHRRSSSDTTNNATNSSSNGSSARGLPVIRAITAGG